MKHGRFIGIDFGTTNTAVVHVISDQFGSRITHLGEDGEYPFSSIVAIPKNDGPLLLEEKSGNNGKSFLKPMIFIYP
jgi:molecular chaperone DnaK (HSP70)